MLLHILFIYSDTSCSTQWFIYSFMRDDASMARYDKGPWQKSTWWSELCLDIKRYTPTSPLPENRKSKDVKIVGAEILLSNSVLVRRLNVSIQIVAICTLGWGRVYRSVYKCSFDISFCTTPSIFNWRFTNNPLILSMWKFHQLLGKY